MQGHKYVAWKVIHQGKHLKCDKLGCIGKHDKCGNLLPEPGQGAKGPWRCYGKGPHLCSTDTGDYVDPDGSTEVPHTADDPTAVLKVCDRRLG